MKSELPRIWDPWLVPTQHKTYKLLIRSVANRQREHRDYTISRELTAAGWQYCIIYTAGDVRRRAAAQLKDTLMFGQSDVDADGI